MRNTATKRAGRAAVAALAAVAVSAACGVSSASALKWNEVANGSSVAATLEGSLTLRTSLQWPWEPGVTCSVETDVFYNTNGVQFPSIPVSTASNSGAGAASFLGRSLAFCDNGRRFGIVLNATPGYAYGTLNPRVSIWVSPYEHTQESPLADLGYYHQASSVNLPITMGTTGAVGSKITFSNTTIGAPTSINTVATGTLEFKQAAGGTLTLSH